MDETERERSRREKFAYFDDVFERLTAMGITDLKTRMDIAEHEWYLFTLNCEYYEQERLKRYMERERQREIERECLRLMDEEEAARHVETPNADHGEKQESATDHDLQPEDEKRGDGGAELGTDATEGDGDEPESETTESLDLLREIDEMLSDATSIIGTAAKNAIPRLKTGIPSLDEKLGGGLAAGVHILMAPPSTGKTAQSLFICKKAISDKANDWGDEQVLYWGLDTSEPDVRARLASCVSLLKGKELGIEPFAYKDVPSDELIRLNELREDVERYRKNPTNHERELRECKEAIKEIMGGIVGDYLKAADEVERTMFRSSPWFRFMKPTDRTRNEIREILGEDCRPNACENHSQMLENLLELRPYVYEDDGYKDMDTAREMLKDYCSYEELEENHLIGNHPQGDEVELLLSYLYAWGNVRLCVVDFLQRLKIAPKNGSGDEYQKTVQILDLLSNAAMELKIPIIVISSMSVEAIRSNKPNMMNVNGSTRLSYDVETITEMRAEQGEKSAKTVTLHIVKNKSYKPCALKLKYLPAYNCFGEVKEAKQEDAGTAREGR